MTTRQLSVMVVAVPPPWELKRGVTPETIHTGEVERTLAGKLAGVMSQQAVAAGLFAEHMSVLFVLRPHHTAGASEVDTAVLLNVHAGDTRHEHKTPTANVRISFVAIPPPEEIEAGIEPLRSPLTTYPAENVPEALTKLVAGLVIGPEFARCVMVFQLAPVYPTHTPTGATLQ
jgi:hypothetical protein